MKMIDKYHKGVMLSLKLHGSSRMTQEAQREVYIMDIDVGYTLTSRTMGLDP